MKRLHLGRRPAIVLHTDGDFQRILSQYGFASVGDVLRAIDCTEEELGRRLEACVICGQLGLQSAIPLLLESIREQNDSIAWESGVALSLIRSRKATRNLIQLIVSSAPSPNREAAVYALIGIQDARARHALLSVLENGAEHSQLRALAAEALGLLPPKDRVVQALTRSLQDGDASVRFGALCGIAGLVGLGNKDVNRAVELLVNDDSLGSGGETVGERARLVLQAL